MPAISKLDEVLELIKSKNQKVPLDQIESFLKKRDVKPDEIKQSEILSQARGWKMLGHKNVPLDDIDNFIKSRVDKIKLSEPNEETQKFIRGFSFRPFESTARKESPDKDPYITTIYELPKNAPKDTYLRRAELAKKIKQAMYDEGWESAYNKRFVLSNTPKMLTNGSMSKEDVVFFSKLFRDIDDKRYEAGKRLFGLQVTDPEYLEASRAFMDSKDELSKQKLALLDEIISGEYPGARDAKYDMSSHTTASNHFSGAKDYISHVRGYDLPDRRTIFELQSDIHQHSKGRYGPPAMQRDALTDSMLESWLEQAEKLKASGDTEAYKKHIRSVGNYSLSQLFNHYQNSLTEDAPELAKRIYSQYAPNSWSFDDKTDDWFEDAAEAAKLYLNTDRKDPRYHRMLPQYPDQPFKDNKWVGRTLEMEIDKALSEGKSFEILRDLDGRNPAITSRGDEPHKKYYNKGGVIDKELKKLADKHGLKVEDVEEIADHGQVINKIVVTDPQKRGGIDYYQYGKVDPALLATLGAAGGGTAAINKFLAERQPRDLSHLAAGDTSYYGSASQSGSGQNFANAGQNLITDWLEQYYKGKNNIAGLFYADDPNKHTAEMDYIKKRREQYQPQNNPVYDIGSFLLGP